MCARVRLNFVCDDKESKTTHVHNCEGTDRVVLKIHPYKLHVIVTAMHGGCN